MKWFCLPMKDVLECVLKLFKDSLAFVSYPRCYLRQGFRINCDHDQPSRTVEPSICNTYVDHLRSNTRSQSYTNLVINSLTVDHFSLYLTIELLKSRSAHSNQILIVATFVARVALLLPHKQMTEIQNIVSNNKNFLSNRHSTNLPNFTQKA